MTGRTTDAHGSSVTISDVWPAYWPENEIITPGPETGEPGNEDRAEPAGPPEWVRSEYCTPRRSDNSARKPRPPGGASPFPGPGQFQRRTDRKNPESSPGQPF